MAAVSDIGPSNVASVDQPSETRLAIDKALAIANEILSKEFPRHTLVWIQQLSGKQPKTDNLIEAQYNQQLGLEIDGEREQMGMIDPKGIDGISLKSPESLADEIVRQVRMHLSAKKVERIMFFKNGHKLDHRLLERHAISIDAEGFLNVNGLRLMTRVGDEFWPLRADAFRSYTIARWINEKDDIRVFDEHDLIRSDRKGMVIRLSRVHNIAINQLVERARESAVSYPDLYYEVVRDYLSDAQIEDLSEKIKKFPEP
jgi:hypothetical protein